MRIIGRPPLTRRSRASTARPAHPPAPRQAACSTFPFLSTRSSTSKRSSGGTNGADGSANRSYSAGRFCRPICRMSLNPRVAMKCRPRSLAFEQGIGGHRRAVDDSRFLSAVLCEDSFQSLQDCLGRVVRRGEQLESLYVSAFRGEDNEVRECAADVDADAQGGHGGYYKTG